MAGYCPRCGTAVADDTYRFCGRCGTGLPAADSAPSGSATSLLVAPPPGEATTVRTVASPLTPVPPSWPSEAPAPRPAQPEQSAPAWLSAPTSAQAPHPTSTWLSDSTPAWPGSPSPGTTSTSTDGLDNASTRSRIRRAHLILWGTLVVLAIGSAFWIKRGNEYYYDYYDQANVRGIVLDVLALAAFLIAARLLPTTTQRRAVAVVLVFAASLVCSYSPQAFPYMPLGDSPARALHYAADYGVAVPVLLAAWLVLRNRAAPAFLLLVPAALLGVLRYQVETIDEHIVESLGGFFSAPALVFYALDTPLIVGAFALIAARVFPGAEPIANAGAAASPTSAGYPGSASADDDAASPGGYPYAAYPGGYPGGIAPQNTMAVLGFVLSFVVSIAGVACSHVALSQIKRTGERGRGLAIAGLVIGYLGVALTIAYVIFIAAVLAG